MSRTVKREKTGPKAIDPTCKNHGTCPACQEARKRQVRKEMRGMKEALEEAFPGLEAHIVYGDPTE